LEDSIQDKVDSFIYDKIEKYDLVDIESFNLLTWNRFDLAFKLSYLELYNLHNPFATEIYKYDIFSQSLGKFSEFGNNEKSNFESYIKTFNSILDDIKTNGFNSDKSLIPISSNASILNGAHRTAASIFLNKKVKCLNTYMKSLTIDYNYFYERKVPREILDFVTQTFIEFSPNTFIAFLWPSGNKLKPGQVEDIFKKVVYKREIRLNANGAYNLLIELYKHMDWSGNYKNSFRPIKNKLIESFKNFNSFEVVAFQADSIEDVRIIKEKVRYILGKGYSSIHITDTHEEAIRISKMVFNLNGINFLNLSLPYKFKATIFDLKKHLSFFKDNNINIKRTLIIGDPIYSLMGHKSKNNFKILHDYESSSFKKKLSPFFKNEFYLNKDSLKKIIYDPNFYFWYNGLKFLSLNYFKEELTNDLIHYKIESKKIRNVSFKQFFFYHKIVLHKILKETIFNFLKLIKLYNFFRFFYRQLNNK
jgi:hypothetical protein